jgi:hypothetical protein
MLSSVLASLEYFDGMEFDPIPTRDKAPLKILKV